jgi:hypothetical protein
MSTKPSISARARGRRHARALRDVAWANGQDVANAVESPEDTGVECHSFATKAHAQAAQAVWAAQMPHAPLPPRWGLVVRLGEVGGMSWPEDLWVVSVVDDAGVPTANL